MKGNNRIWYIGYALSLLLIVMMFCNDFSKTMDMALIFLFSAVFSISYIQLAAPENDANRHNLSHQRQDRTQYLYQGKGRQRCSDDNHDFSGNCHGFADCIGLFFTSYHDRDADFTATDIAHSNQQYP